MIVKRGHYAFIERFLIDSIPPIIRANTFHRHRTNLLGLKMLPDLLVDSRMRTQIWLRVQETSPDVFLRVPRAQMCPEVHLGGRV